MIIKGFNGTINNINSVHGSEKKRAKAFLKKKVYCWCKNQPDKEFAARDLVGGKNKNWNGTPLQKVYKHHRHSKSIEKAYTQAGIDVGWLLKGVLHDDERCFELIKRDVNHYKWLNK